MSSAVIVPLVVIVMLLAWAIGFVSGALFIYSRYERSRGR